MDEQIEVVVFDVNETLSDMAPLAGRFEQVGAPAHLAKTWFASVLRDGFGLCAAGASAPFLRVASGVLRSALAEAEVADLDAAVEHVLSGLSALDLHPDVPDGLRALTGAGMRVVSLTNGAAHSSEDLFERAGVRTLFERVLSVEDAGRWKPAPTAYAYAADVCNVPPEAMLLVAVHPWDIDGAARAGLRTAWVNRTGVPYPQHMQRPQLVIRGVDELAGRLR